MESNQRQGTPFIRKHPAGKQRGTPFQIIKEEKEYTSDFQIPREKEIACFDADKLNEEISYRKWQTGDTFIPFGMKGKKK